MLRQISFSSTKPVTSPPDEQIAHNFMAKLFFDEAKHGSIDFLSDFTLKSGIDDKEYKAHKIILASQSKYFRGFFRNTPNTSSVSLNYDHLVIEACIEGLYTGATPITFENVQDILMAADYLGIDDIVKQATNFIILNMDDSNCYEILMFGCGHGFEKLSSSAASYIGKRMHSERGRYLEYDEVGNSGEELYALPLGMFSRVLESYAAIIKEEKLGIFMTEFEFLPFIEKYLGIHPENQFEDVISCCRLDGFNYRKVEEYELVKQTLLIVLNTNLELWEKVYAANRATQIRHEMDNDPVTVFRHSSQTLQPMHGEEIVDIYNQLSEEMKKKLIYYAQKGQQSLCRAISLKQRKWNKCTTQFTNVYGLVPDGEFPEESLHRYNKKVGIIKKIVIHTRHFRSSIKQFKKYSEIIKGMEIYFLGNDQAITFGLDDGPGNTREEFDLGEDEYIAYVEGRSEYYLDQITFVTNKNRKLGPVGGNGGETFRPSTLQDTNCSKLFSKNISLVGIEASKVHTQYQDTITRVRFLMCLMNENEIPDDSADLLDMDYDVPDYRAYVNFVNAFENDPTITMGEENTNLDN